MIQVPQDEEFEAVWFIPWLLSEAIVKIEFIEISEHGDRDREPQDLVL
jgi:hypothetical protein